MISWWSTVPRCGCRWMRLCFGSRAAPCCTCGILHRLSKCSIILRQGLVTRGFMFQHVPTWQLKHRQAGHKCHKSNMNSIGTRERGPHLDMLRSPCTLRRTQAHVALISYLQHVYIYKCMFRFVCVNVESDFENKDCSRVYPFVCVCGSRFEYKIP